eukprot:CAMPEP_0173272090 /NCGR_PEP_ID=MMETSP1143-20121109/1171_1 /TAXON_ID=483371 /ORGANISM="non described non described, Strain CCMP2298" /LENGTH=42 /DNA_ID= /DNA_START= /DNA_END= /DNA_ORIENTATION=
MPVTACCHVMPGQQPAPAAHARTGAPAPPLLRDERAYYECVR